MTSKYPGHPFKQRDLLLPPIIFSTFHIFYAKVEAEHVIVITSSITNLPFPGDSEGFSSQAATCHTPTTHGGGLPLSLQNAEH